RQGRPTAESRIPRLPDTGVLGPADDRHPDSGDSKSQSPLRRAWGGRDVDRAAARGDRQCGVERDRRAHDAYPHVASPHSRRPRGGKSGLVVEVNLWGSLAASAGGADKLTIEAKDIRELLRKLAERYPGVE